MTGSLLWLRQVWLYFCPISSMVFWYVSLVPLQYRIGSETESMNSISSTDDTFQWGGAQDESLRFGDESHGLMDSCLWVFIGSKQYNRTNIYILQCLSMLSANTNTMLFYFCRKCGLEIRWQCCGWNRNYIYLKGHHYKSIGKLLPTLVLFNGAHTIILSKANIHVHNHYIEILFKTHNIREIL